MSTHLRSPSCGVGLDINFSGSTRDIHFKVINCTFSNNKAQKGAGLLMVFSNCVANNSLKMIDTFFTGYMAEGVPSGQGGGLLVAFVMPNYNGNGSCIIGNQVSVNKTRFESNSAWEGGGMCVIGSQHKASQEEQNNLIQVSNSNWSSNTALSGAAIALTLDVWDSLDRGSLPSVQISSC